MHRNLLSAKATKMAVYRRLKYGRSSTHRIGIYQMPESRRLQELVGKRDILVGY
jgi:hypothetical protein